MSHLTYLATLGRDECVLRRARFLPLSRQPSSRLQTPTRHPSQAGEGRWLLGGHGTGRGLDRAWASSEAFEPGLTLLALKAREDFNAKRVKIHFWKTFSASTGRFCGAELALAALALAEHGTGHFSSDQHLAGSAKKKGLFVLG